MGPLNPSSLREPSFDNVVHYGFRELKVKTSYSAIVEVCETHDFQLTIDLLDPSDRMKVLKHVLSILRVE